MKFIYPAEAKPQVVKNHKDMEEWGAQPCEHTWKELCMAAESVDPSKQPLCRKRRASAVDGSDIHGTQTLLIKTSKLEVYKYYSSVERVKEKIRQFDMIQDWEIEALVQEAIWTAKAWYMNDLYYQYALFLPECELVMRSTHTGRTWELADDPMFIKQKFISEDLTFTKNKFHFLTSFKIAYGLKQYFNFMSNLSFWGKNKAIVNYNNYISRQREREKEEYRKIMKTLPIGFYTPIHFLVCQERDKRCSIQEPLLELTKIRAYFDGFLKMPKRMSLNLEVRTTYCALMEEAAKLEEEDPIREVNFEDEEPMVESEEEEPMESEEVCDGN